MAADGEEMRPAIDVGAIVDDPALRHAEPFAADGEEQRPRGVQQDIDLEPSR